MSAGYLSGDGFFSRILHGRAQGAVEVEGVRQAQAEALSKLLGEYSPSLLPPRLPSTFQDRAFGPAPSLPPPALVAGPILAWRVWGLVEINGSVRLQSLNQSTIYPPRQPMTGVGVGSGTSAGIYACKTREMAAEYIGPQTGWFISASNASNFSGFATTTMACGHHVLGQIALWGRVIEHEHGYRAEWGYPWRVEILKAPTPSPMPGFPWAPPGPSLADRLRETYGCEVVEV